MRIAILILCFEVILITSNSGCVSRKTSSDEAVYQHALRYCECIKEKYSDADRIIDINLWFDNSNNCLTETFASPSLPFLPLDSLGFDKFDDNELMENSARIVKFYSYCDSICGISLLLSDQKAKYYNKLDSISRKALLDQFREKKMGH